jgi:hypothetical protein
MTCPLAISRRRRRGRRALLLGPRQPLDRGPPTGIITSCRLIRGYQDSPTREPP